MKAARAIDIDRPVRTAAWWYITPRRAIAIFIFATLGLAALLLFMQFVLVILRQLGA